MPSTLNAIRADWRKAFVPRSTVGKVCQPQHSGARPICLGGSLRAKRERGWARGQLSETSQSAQQNRAPSHLSRTAGTARTEHSRNVLIRARLNHLVEHLPYPLGVGRPLRLHEAHDMRYANNFRCLVVIFAQCKVTAYADRRSERKGRQCGN